MHKTEHRIQHSRAIIYAIMCVGGPSSLRCVGHSIPNQQKKIRTPFDFHEIWHKHGPYQETFLHQNLAHFIGLPLSYDHSKFLLKISFYLHVFNKMTITLLMIDVDTSGLDF